jgi:isopentenyl-diphosphate Delta-isomerase
MPQSKTSKRKKDHINLCLTDDVKFISKTNGFDKYDFEHNAVTEVVYGKIDLNSKFFAKKINYPFLISCMTGGTKEAKKINEKLALVAKELNIPIGIGSQRQALENDSFHQSYKIVRKNAGNVPIIGNIGAAQVAKSKNIVDEIKLLIDMVEADAMAIHVNPLQELLQAEGEPDFNGILNNLELLSSKIKTPLIVKEVGSGISKKVAKKLLDVGVKGIDVAGAGGTSWASVELKRNRQENKFLSEWGLPTSYCIRTVCRLRRNYDFTLIASGGINNGVDIAKAIALGADMCATARIILQEVVNNDIEGVINLIDSWFKDVKNIMYLTGYGNIKKFTGVGLLSKEDMY